MNKKLLLFVFFFTFLSLPIFAQVADSTKCDDENCCDKESECSKNEDNDEGFWKLFKKWRNRNWADWEIRGTPFVEANYGLGDFKYEPMHYGFKRIGSVEVKLGHSNRKDFYDEKVITFRDKYFFVSRLGSDIIETDPKVNQLRTEMWRFGFAKRLGYGYKLNNLYVMPYHASGYVWSRLHMKDFPPSVWPAIFPPMPGQVLAEKDRHLLDRINDTFRFGTNVESGINFDIASRVGINVGYEATVVFPHHMFWKHLGSAIIESAGMDLLERFIEEVADSSPLSVPFVNFVLKGAYSYAFYSLKKDKMNWPFKTEAPLTYETVKFGVSFTF